MLEKGHCNGSRVAQMCFTDILKWAEDAFDGNDEEGNNNYDSTDVYGD